MEEAAKQGLTKASLAGELQTGSIQRKTRRDWRGFWEVDGPKDYFSSAAVHGVVRLANLARVCLTVSGVMAGASLDQD